MMHPVDLMQQYNDAFNIGGLGLSNHFCGILLFF